MDSSSKTDLALGIPAIININNSSSSCAAAIMKFLLYRSVTSHWCWGTGVQLNASFSLGRGPKVEGRRTALLAITRFTHPFKRHTQISAFVHYRQRFLIRAPLP
ncbi:hypothetical protein CDAR_172371 [Caerostris darwini]|uniref:Uncharacterized protein n=1 Tax=Caerostris darwini TaxID=1538125 RepID=A0AAV4MFW5_9ARAC|nr:hypothetical protein CDAR_172371 [Caerostris darwini]